MDHLLIRLYKKVIKVPVQGGVTPPTEFMDKETIYARDNTN